LCLEEFPQDRGMNAKITIEEKKLVIRLPAWLNIIIYPIWFFLLVVFGICLVISILFSWIFKLLKGGEKKNEKSRINS